MAEKPEASGVRDQGGKPEHTVMVTTCLLQCLGGSLATLTGMVVRAQWKPWKD